MVVFERKWMGNPRTMSVNKSNQFCLMKIEFFLFVEKWSEKEKKIEMKKKKKKLKKEDKEKKYV